MSDGDVCSMCLDPFALERCPKRLPCSHAFCLPCLEELIQHAATKSQMSTESTCCAEEMRSQALEAAQPVTFPCPTCRVNTIVPAGGVTQFPSNLLQLDKEHKLSSNTLPCDLCDGSQDAVYSCSDCHNNFCSFCDKIHRKLTSDHHVQSLLTKVQTGEEYDLDNKMKENAEKQAMIVEKALAQLWEEESKIEEEIKLMADKINTRYSTLIMYINEARAKSEQDLEMVTESTRNKLQNYKSKARRILSDLWHVIHSYDVRNLGHGPMAKLQATLMPEDELQFYKQLAFGRSKYFNWFVHKADDNCISPDSVLAYIGSVISVDLTTDISRDVSFSSTVEIENDHVTVDDSSKASRQELVHVEPILEDLVSNCVVSSHNCAAQPVEITSKQLQDQITIQSEKLCQELKYFRDVFSNGIIKKTLHQRELGDVRSWIINHDCHTEVFNGHVMFHGCHSKQSYRLSQYESNFVFDHVVSNVGDGYNPQNGAFTATFSGTYLFLLVADFRCTTHFSFKIAVDNVVVATVPLIYLNGRSTLCAHVVVKMNAGQKAFIVISDLSEDKWLKPEPLSKWLHFNNSKNNKNMENHLKCVLLCDHNCGLDE